MRLYEFATETGKPFNEEELNEAFWIPAIIWALSAAATVYGAAEIISFMKSSSKMEDWDEILDYWYYDATEQEKEELAIGLALLAGGLVFPGFKGLSAIGKWGSASAKSAKLTKETAKLNKEAAKIQAQLDKIAAKQAKLNPKRVEPTLSKSNVDINALGKGKLKINNIDSPAKVGAKARFQVSKDGKTVIDLKTGKPVQKDTMFVGSSGRPLKRNVTPDEFDIGGA